MRRRLPFHERGKFFPFQIMRVRILNPLRHAAFYYRFRIRLVFSSKAPHPVFRLLIILARGAAFALRHDLGHFGFGFEQRAQLVEAEHVVVLGHELGLLVGREAVAVGF